MCWPFKKEDFKFFNKIKNSEEGLGMSKKYLLNSPVLTDYGIFMFKKIGLEEAKEFTRDTFVSAIGHEGTARLLSALLGTDIPVNRIAIRMERGSQALVCRLKTRLEEGRVLNFDELRELYNNGLIEFGILERIE